MTPSIFGAVSSPSSLGMSQSAAPLITLIRGRSNSDTLPLATLTANASCTAAASSGGMHSAFGASTLISSCDKWSPLRLPCAAELVNQRDLQSAPQGLRERRPKVVLGDDSLPAVRAAPELFPDLPHEAGQRVRVVVFRDVLAQLRFLQSVHDLFAVIQ